MLAWLQACKLHGLFIVLSLLFCSYGYAEELDLNGDWQLKQGDNIGVPAISLSIKVEGNKIKGFLKKADPQYGYAAGEMVLRGEIDKGKINKLEKVAKPYGSLCTELAQWKSVRNIKLEEPTDKTKTVTVTQQGIGKKTEVQLTSWKRYISSIKGKWTAGIFLLDMCNSLDVETDFILERVKDTNANLKLAATTLDPKVDVKSVNLLGLMRIKAQQTDGRLFVSKPILMSVPTAKQHQDFVELHA